MARVFKCDKCGTIIEDDSLMTKVCIEFYNYDFKESYWKTFDRKTKEVCPDCFEYLKSMMED